MNLNHVTIAGRLTRDPDTLRYTPGGTAIVDIGVAVSHFSKDDQGQTKESTDFIDITAFGRTAETIQKHLSKGNPIYVEGRLKLEQWQDKTTNQPRSKLKVIAESMQFVGPRAAAASDSPPQRQTAPPARAAATAPRSQPTPDPDLDSEPDDIPF
jgi:single-strand DNA-binding protein